jgi:hypothetical protein
MPSGHVRGRCEDEDSQNMVCEINLAEECLNVPNYISTIETIMSGNDIGVIACLVSWNLKGRIIETSSEIWSQLVHVSTCKISLVHIRMTIAYPSMDFNHYSVL